MCTPKFPRVRSISSTWLDSIKHGHTFATNGPLLGFSLGGKQPGDDLSLPAGENKVKFTAWLRSFVPVDHLQVICNGEVVRDLKVSGDREAADVEDTIPVSRSGWCLLRAWSDKAEHPVLDMYPYATTSPDLYRGRPARTPGLPKTRRISSPGSIA